ncbi:TRAP transporter small permease [Tahibacter amnicola]|uniref:TRAP transporter small permease protein n=1 Tax=Tahibacter amnicola TaxID=2976241 RepID=A0ABY6BE38_9GAMM|nr:TRAP transporter small permease [Tahibacter amnicola]UXI66595.1 TRAP transporter small permease [Tahibacter amnicola]
MTDRLRRLVTRVHLIEDWVLTAFVLVLVVLAGAQILLRNVFDSGFAWAEPLLRALVLWSAMLGAVIATREDQHIGLDFIARFVSGWKLRVARFLALAFAGGLCAAMTWHSLALVQLDKEGGTPGVLGIPAWGLELVLPIGFGLMAIRFLIRAFMPPHDRHGEEPGAAA